MWNLIESQVLINTVIKLVKKNDPSVYKYLRIYDFNPATGWEGFTVEVLSVGGSASNNDEFLLELAIAGTDGTSGISGTSGSSGISGTSGSSGTSVSISGTNNTVVKFTSSNTIGNSQITDDGTTVSMTGALGVGSVTAPTTSGLIRAANDIIAFASSDERLKENKVILVNSLDKVNRLNGYEFDWIPMLGIHENEGRDIGVIAQEVEKVLPEIVTTRDNGYKAVKYEKIVPVLIEAIKELSREIKELKKQIDKE